MKNLFLNRLVCALLLIALIGCGSSNTTTSGGTGSIVAKLQWDDGKSSSILKFFGIHTAAAPAGVVTVRIIVNGPNMSDIQKDFAASAGEGQVDGVPAGTNRILTAQGLNSNASIIYEGSKGNLTVVGGQTTDAGIITMLPYGTTACLDLVNQGKIVEARDVCVSSADAYGSTQSNDADTTRFFAALSRIASLWYNMSSDGNPNNGLNTFGDILDAFGCSNSGREPLRPESLNSLCPSILPANAPTGSDLQAFIRNVLRPEVENAIGNLNNVSQSLNVMWTEPFDGKQVKSDYGDVLAIRASLSYLLGSVIIENSYDLNANIGTATNQHQTKEAFLAANPDFLKLVNSAELSMAQNLLGAASDDALAAINWMQAETGDQSSHFISLSKMTPAQINRAKIQINEFKSSLSGPSTIHNDSNVAIGTLDSTKFFVGLNIRSLLPNFHDNCLVASSTIPGKYFLVDPTFNGTWTNWSAFDAQNPTNPNSHYDPNYWFGKQFGLWTGTACVPLWFF